MHLQDQHEEHTTSFDIASLFTIVAINSIPLIFSIESSLMNTSLLCPTLTLLHSWTCVLTSTWDVLPVHGWSISIKFLSVYVFFITCWLCLHPSSLKTNFSKHRNWSLSFSRPHNCHTAPVCKHNPSSLLYKSLYIKINNIDSKITFTLEFKANGKLPLLNSVEHPRKIVSIKVYRKSTNKDNLAYFSPHQSFYAKHHIIIVGFFPSTQHVVLIIKICWVEAPTIFLCQNNTWPC